MNATTSIYWRECLFGFVCPNFGGLILHINSLIAPIMVFMLLGRYLICKYFQMLMFVQLKNVQVKELSEHLNVYVFSIRRPVTETSDVQ